MACAHKTAAAFCLGLARRLERVHVGSYSSHVCCYSHYVGCHSLCVGCYRRYGGYHRNRVGYIADRWDGMLQALWGGLL